MDYDVSYFTPVNEHGEEIAQDRVRRDTTIRKQRFYNISITGLTLHLNLTINEHLLAPGFHVETKHRNGSITNSTTPQRKFYHGHVVSYPGSRVALSGENRLVSIIKESAYKIKLLRCY